MITNLYEGKLTFITPCFCAGADQNKPEIRAASIRGQLRWWFRVLGGTKIQEANVFGGTGHAGSEAKSSSVVVRVSDVKPIFGETIKSKPTTIEQYLYYFAEVSGKKDGVCRTEVNHYFAPGTSFLLTILLRKKITDAKAIDLLNKSIDLFLCLGAIGLRATRGCGCFTAEGKDAVGVDYSNIHGLFVNSIRDEEYSTGKAAQIELGNWLKHFRSENRLSGKKPSALGYSAGSQRESSALKLRPVEHDGKFLPYIYYSDAACSQPSIKNLLDKF